LRLYKFESVSHPRYKSLLKMLTTNNTTPGEVLKLQVRRTTRAAYDVVIYILYFSVF